MEPVNLALRDFTVKPDCPFDDLELNMIIQAAGQGEAQANGQRVSVEAG